MTKLDKEIKETLFDPKSKKSKYLEADIVEDMVGKNVYARATEYKDEKSFLLSRSEDLWIPSLSNFKKGITEQELQTEIDRLGIDGAIIHSKEGYGIRYNGVNALQYYDKDMFHKEYPHIVIFEGKYLSSNIIGDGDIIKPLKVIQVINRKEHSLLYDPKKTPSVPSRWYVAMVKGIKKSSDVRNPYAIVKSIWSKLSPSGKAKIRAREAKGERFRYDLPLPVDKPTRGTGTVRMVKPFKLAEVQVNLSIRDYLTALQSGIFSKMKRDDGTTALVARCKSPEKNVNIFVDKAGGK